MNVVRFNYLYILCQFYQKLNYLFLNILYFFVFRSCHYSLILKIQYQLALKWANCHTLQGAFIYFFRATELDALVFGHLFTLLTTSLPEGNFAEVIQQFTNLTEFCMRIDEKYFKQNQSCCYSVHSEILGYFIRTVFVHACI